MLPLQDLSSSQSEEDYFADGMTEALINNLAKIGALKVISRTSVMQYKGIQKPLLEIANELGVDAVVEGSVLRAEGRIRITANLIEAATEQNLWAESYEGDLRDVLALQSEVAQAIAQEIRVATTAEEQTRLAAAPAVDPESYNLYLLGRHYLNRQLDLEPDLIQAIGYFNQALEVDSNYAPAYAGLANAYAYLGRYHIRAPEEAWPKMKIAAERAVLGCCCRSPDRWARSQYRA